MISRRIVLFAGAVCVAGVLGIDAGPGRAAAADPDEFIRAMGQEAIDSLTGTELSMEQREAGFRRILCRAFDMRTIARFTLGRYWRIASKSEREEYVTLFETYIVQAYTARFKNYTGESFKVGKVHTINERDKLVESSILRPQGPPISVNWRVRDVDGKLRIVDVVVEGVSMGITQRAEFASVIRNTGGKVEGLLEALRKKTGKRPAISPAAAGQPTQPCMA